MHWLLPHLWLVVAGVAGGLALNVARADDIGGVPQSNRNAINLESLATPIIFKGDATTAYRDPAVLYHDGMFHLYFTFVKTEPDGRPYLYTAWSRSTNLAQWTEPHIFTPRDLNLNFSSPGNVVRFSNEWVLCHQTYPRPAGQKHGSSDARVWMRRGRDGENWSEPELLRVKGPEVLKAKMGRMIDPYLLEDKDEPGKWWCFFKQNGASMSWSRDLKTWNYSGRVEAGENVCVLVVGGEYVMFHSPGNGIGVKRSRELKTWRDAGLIKLGQENWPWAKGRLTAGFVLDLTREPRIGKYLLFFHGSGPEDERTMFDNFASIGIAWSDDLKQWNWPGKSSTLRSLKLSTTSKSPASN
jgi:hypothetical protein